MSYLQKKGGTVTFHTTSKELPYQTRECGCSYGHSCECGITDLQNLDDGLASEYEVCNECEACTKNAASLVRTGRPGKRKCLDPPHLRGRYTQITVGDQQIRVLKSTLLSQCDGESNRGSSSSLASHISLSSMRDVHQGNDNEDSKSVLDASNVPKMILEIDETVAQAEDAAYDQVANRAPREILRQQRIAYTQRKLELEALVAKEEAQHLELTTELRSIQDRSAAVDPSLGDKMMVDTKILHGTWQRMSILQAEQLIVDRAGKLEETLIVNRKELADLTEYLEHRCAVVIQRMVRGMITRHQFGSVVKLYQEYHRHTSAMSIQSMYRSWKARGEFQQLRFLWHSRCALVIECAWKSYQARCELRRRRYREWERIENEASGVIQKMFRTFRSRAILRVMRAEAQRVRVEEDRNFQAMMIQKIVRGRLARNKKFAMRVELRLNPRLRYLCNKHIAKGDLYKFLEEVNRDYEIHEVQQEEIRQQETENAELFIKKVLEVRSEKAKQGWEKWEALKVSKLLQSPDKQKASGIAATATQLRNLPYLKLASPSLGESSLEPSPMLQGSSFVDVKKSPVKRAKQVPADIQVVPRAKDKLDHLHKQIKTFENKVMGAPNGKPLNGTPGGLPTDHFAKVYRTGKHRYRPKRVNYSYLSNLAKPNEGPLLRKEGRVARQADIEEGDYQELKRTYLQQLEAKSALPESTTHLISQAWKEWDQVGDVAIRDELPSGIKAERKGQRRPPPQHARSRTSANVKLETHPARVPLRVVQRSKLPGARSLDQEIPSLNEPLDRLVLYAVMMSHVPQSANALLSPGSQPSALSPIEQFRNYMALAPPLAKVTYEQESLEVAKGPIALLKQCGYTTCGSLLGKDLTEAGISGTLSSTITYVVSELRQRLDATRPASIQEKWNEATALLTPREIGQTSSAPQDDDEPPSFRASVAQGRHNKHDVEVAESQQYFGDQLTNPNSLTHVINPVVATDVEVNMSVPHISATENNVERSAFAITLDESTSHSSAIDSDVPGSELRNPVYGSALESTLDESAPHSSAIDSDVPGSELRNPVHESALESNTRDDYGLKSSTSDLESAKSGNETRTSTPNTASSRPMTAETVVFGSTSRPSTAYDLQQLQNAALLEGDVYRGTSAATPVFPAEEAQQTRTAMSPGNKWRIAKVGQALRLPVPAGASEGAEQLDCDRTERPHGRREEVGDVFAAMEPLHGRRPGSTDTCATIDWNRGDLAVPGSRERAEIVRRRERGRRAEGRTHPPAKRGTTLHALVEQDDPVESLVMQVCLENVTPAEALEDLAMESKESLVHLPFAEFMEKVDSLPPDAQATRLHVVRERLKAIRRVSRPVVDCLTEAGFRTVRSLAACPFQDLGVSEEVAELISSALDQLNMRGIHIRGYHAREALPTIKDTKRQMTEHRGGGAFEQKAWEVRRIEGEDERSCTPDIEGAVSPLDIKWRQLTSNKARARKRVAGRRHDQLVARVLSRAKARADKFILSGENDESAKMSYSDWKAMELIGMTSSANPGDFKG